MRVFNAETFSYENKQAATSSLVINIRSSEGIINKKVELDVLIDESAFKNENKLQFIWGEDSFSVSRVAGDSSTVLWSSVQEDDNFQAEL